MSAANEDDTEPPEEHRPDLVGDGHDPERLLTYEEVADILALSDPRAVYDLPIPRVRVSENRVRWRPTDVREFIQRRVEEPS